MAAFLPITLGGPDRGPRRELMDQGPLLARPAWSAVVLVAALCWLGGSPPGWSADPPSLGIELNKVENTEQGCRSIFLFNNETGHDLNRFRMDLILFDPKGIYAKQLMLDMAPLYENKRTVATFLLDDVPCEQIGSILVNGVPLCEDGAGTAVDCVSLLEVKSRSGIPLEK
jgi:hypothetical protein